MVESLSLAAVRNDAAERSRGSPFIRRDLIYGLALLFIWLAVSLPRLEGPIDLRWDASTYYILGTALAEGKGYRLLNEPGNIEAVQYPPLLPLMVALQQRLMGTSDYFTVGRALRLTYFLLSGIYLLVVYALARQMLSPLHAFFVGAITGLSFNSFVYPSETLYADLPFAFVSILFLVCHRKRNSPAHTVAAGGLACASYLLRTAGIVLLAAWVIESLMRCRWKEAMIRAAVAAIPVLAWQCYILHVTGNQEYHQPIYSYQRASYNYPNVTYAENSSLKHPFQPELGHSKTSDIFNRIIRNAVAIPVGLGESSWFGRPFLQYPLSKLSHILPRGSQRIISRFLGLSLVAVGLAALAGAVLMAMRGEWFLSLYFGLTLAVVVLTPWQSQFWRYLSPIAPLTLIFLIVTLLIAGNALARSFAMQSAATNTLITIVFTVMSLVQAGIAVVFLRNLLPVSYYDAFGRERALHLLTYGAPDDSLDSAFEWIRRHATASAVIATAVPHRAYLRTGHKAVLPPFEPDPDRAIQLLDQVPVSYLVVDELKRPPISDRYAAPLVQREPRDWKLVYTSPGKGTQVYERIH